MSSASITEKLVLTDPLEEQSGGTNQTSYNTGDILYASSSNTLNKLSIGANGRILTSDGTQLSWQPPQVAYTSMSFSSTSSTGIFVPEHPSYQRIEVGTPSFGDRIGFTSISSTSSVSPNNSGTFLITWSLVVIVPQSVFFNMAILLNNSLLSNSELTLIQGSSGSTTMLSGSGSRTVDASAGDEFALGLATATGGSSSANVRSYQLSVRQVEF